MVTQDPAGMPPDAAHGGRDAREDCLPTYRAVQSLIAHIGESDRVAGPSADRTQSGPGGGHEDAGPDHAGGIVVIPDADAPTTASPARVGDGGAGLLLTDLLEAPPAAT